MVRRRISFAVAMIAAGVLGAGCGGSSYSSDLPKVIQVTGVTITKTSTSVLVGGDEQLVATVVPANAAEKRVLWSTSDDRIVKVTAAGKITGVAEGTATITVTTVDGGRVAHCGVTVSAKTIAVTSVTLDETTISVATGSSRTLTASVAPANATDQGLTWVIQPSGIANIAANGNIATITGVKVGDATVTVTSQDGAHASATATVHVTPVAVTGVALSLTELTLQAPKAGAASGDSVPVTATVAPADASNREVSWTTSDAAVASVTSTVGSTVTVVAHKEGTATVTVKTAEGGFTQSCKVTVVAAPVANVAVTGVNLNPTVVSLEATPATTTIVYAIVEPADATKKGVYWTTSDKKVLAISPVSGGSATGDSVSGSAVIVTAAGLGAAKLTATTEDGGHQAMADVGVYMVDAEISGTVAGTLHPSSKAGYFDTKIGGAGGYLEVPLGKLVLYSDDSGFQNAGAGVNLFYYGAGTTPAAVGVAIPQVKSYVGIPAAAATPPNGTASLRITVTASAPSGSAPAIALIEHATRKPIIIKSMAEGPPYVFDGVPPGIQVDLVDGAADGQTLNISHVRVEPSSAAAKDITPPADVTSPSATVASATSLTVSWTNPANVDFDHVEISCLSTTSVTVPKTGSTYTFTGLTTGTSYTFTIKAVDSTGNKSAGQSVTATPAAVGPLLDETFAMTLADAVKAAATATPAKVTVSGSKLEYFTDNSGGFEWRASANNGNGRAWFASWGVYDSAVKGYKWTATVGGTPPIVKTYVAIPTTAFTSPASGSLKVTIQASQYQAYTAHHLLVLDQANKVIAIGPALPGGSGDALGGSDPKPYVIDGVRPNTELRITSDQDYLYLGGVKVEASTTAPTDTPTFQ